MLYEAKPYHKLYEQTDTHTIWLQLIPQSQIDLGRDLIKQNEGH